MSGTATVGWLTSRVNELDNFMNAASSSDMFTVLNNAGQAVLTMTSGFPLVRAAQVEMELGAALGQILQVQYEVNQPGGSLDPSKFYSLVAGGATLGLMVFFPAVGAGGAAVEGSLALGGALRALVISGTVGAFMNGPNFLTIASWFQKNIREVFDPAYPRSPDGYPLALTDRANWMLYTEMYALGIRTGKVKVDGARGIVTIIADKMIIVTEIPEDQQTPFMGRKGSTGGGGDGEIGGGGGRVGSVKIYGPAP
jgi:hypothetical protein